jgi:hypothetical protein
MSIGTICLVNRNHIFSKISSHFVCSPSSLVLAILMLSFAVLSPPCASPFFPGKFREHFFFKKMSRNFPQLLRMDNPLAMSHPAMEFLSLPFARFTTLADLFFITQSYIPNTRVDLFFLTQSYIPNTRVDLFFITRSYIPNTRVDLFFLTQSYIPNTRVDLFFITRSYTLHTFIIYS